MLETREYQLEILFLYFKISHFIAVQRQIRLINNSRTLLRSHLNIEATSRINSHCIGPHLCFSMHGLDWISRYFAESVQRHFYHYSTGARTSVPREWTRLVHFTDNLALSVKREATTTNFKVLGRIREVFEPTTYLYANPTLYQLSYCGWSLYVF